MGKKRPRLARRAGGLTCVHVLGIPQADVSAHLMAPSGRSRHSWWVDRFHMRIPRKSATHTQLQARMLSRERLCLC